MHEILIARARARVTATVIALLLLACEQGSSTTGSDTTSAEESTDDDAESTDSTGGELDECEPGASAFSFSSSTLQTAGPNVGPLACTVATLDPIVDGWSLTFACPELAGGSFDLQLSASPAFESLPFEIGDALILELSTESDCLECVRRAISIYSADQAQLQMILFDSSDQVLSSANTFDVEPNTPELLVEQLDTCEGGSPGMSQYSLRFSRDDDELLLPPSERSGELVSGERFVVRVGASTNNPAPGVGTAWRYFGVVVSREP
jgi:hypothetical protein